MCGQWTQYFSGVEHMVDPEEKILEIRYKNTDGKAKIRWVGAKDIKTVWLCKK